MVKFKLKKKEKAIAALVVIALVVVVYFSFFDQTDPYLTVGQVAKHPDKYEGDSIEIRGTVENGTLDVDNREFNITNDNGKYSLHILSNAQLPDKLNEGKDCVVKGKLVVNDDDSLEFHASEITVGCSSKYE